MLKAILSMVAVRGMTLIFPLVLIPLLLKLLGIAQYGEYNVLLATAGIASILINYGFDYSISRNISRVSEEINQVNRIVTSAFYCKFLNYVVVLIALFIYYLINSDLNKFFIMAIFLFSQVLIPIYVFQGMKRMEYLIYNTGFLNILFSFIIVILLVFKFNVTSNMIFLIYSIVNLIAALQMIFFIYKRFNLRIVRIEIHDVIYQFKDGGWIFLSRIMSTGLSQWSIIILSSLLNPVGLGVYTLADKLVRASNSFFYAIQQATYPYFCNSKNNNNAFIKLTSILVVLSLLMVFVFFKSQGLVIHFFPILKNYFTPVTVMFLAIVPMAISGMLGVNYLLSNDYNKEFASILAFSAIFNVFLLFFYVDAGSLFDAAFVLLSTESVVALLMILTMLFKVKIKRNV